MKTAACIILYHPDTDRLRENILAIAKDLDLLILWRNSPEDIPIPEVDVPVVRLGTGENRYIAAPLNECFRYCADRGIDWLLTMDQDSVWEDFSGFVQTAEKYLQDGVIAFAPSVNRNLSATEECIDIDYTITSGSLCHVPSVLAAGGFRESYKDATTRDFVAYLRAQPLLKGILCGPGHLNVVDDFSPTAKQYEVAGNFMFCGQEFTFS